MILGMVVVMENSSVGTGRDGTSTEGMYGLSVVVGQQQGGSSGQVPLEQGESQQVEQELEEGTCTERNLGHNLDGSPSWNSAMIPVISQQLDQLYHYQAQE